MCLGILIHKFLPHIKEKFLPSNGDTDDSDIKCQGNTIQDSTDIQLEVNDAYEQMDIV